MDFEYDPQKSELNKIKHGIDFEEAQAIWNDLESIEFLLAFAMESRHMIIGVIGEFYWSAVITYRDAVVRIISVRPARRNERELYDKRKRV